MGGIACVTATALALVASVLAASVSAARDQDPAAVCTPDPAWGASVDQSSPRLLALINAHRASHGVPSLTVSPQLTAAAVWKARHMATFRYLGADDPAPPVARRFVDRFAACGYSGPLAGEVVGQGYQNADEAAAAWIADRGIRPTIENQVFAQVGVAAASAADGTLYWVIDFGAATGAAAPPPAKPRCRVPAVVGKTLTAAVRAVRRSRCTVGDVSLTVARARRGRVVRQAPRAGRLLAAGGQVKLVVSIGPRRSS